MFGDSKFNVQLHHNSGLPRTKAYLLYPTIPSFCPFQGRSRLLSNEAFSIVSSIGLLYRNLGSVACTSHAYSSPEVIPGQSVVTLLPWLDALKRFVCY